MEQTLEYKIAKAKATYLKEDVQRLEKSKLHRYLSDIVLILAFVLFYAMGGVNLIEHVAWIAKVTNVSQVVDKQFQDEFLIMNVVAVGYILFMTLQLTGLSHTLWMFCVPIWYVGFCVISLTVLVFACTQNDFTLLARGGIYIAVLLIQSMRFSEECTDKKLAKIAQAVTRNEAVSPDPLPKKLCDICKQESMYDLCVSCEKATQPERQRLRSQIMRAKHADVPATLTIVEWLITLNNFHWKCAYCQTGPYEVMEHYIPVTLGGGTTAENCVPACFSCNARKAAKHPEGEGTQSTQTYTPFKSHTPSSARVHNRADRKAK